MLWGRSLVPVTPRSRETVKPAGSQRGSVTADSREETVELALDLLAHLEHDELPLAELCDLGGEVVGLGRLVREGLCRGLERHLGIGIRVSLGGRVVVVRREGLGRGRRGGGVGALAGGRARHERVGAVAEGDVLLDLLLVLVGREGAELLEAPDVGVGQQRGGDGLADVAGPLVGRLEPLLATVHREDDRGGDVALLDREVGDVVEVELLEVLVPDGLADVLDDPGAGDDQGELGEAEGALHGFAGLRDAGGIEHPRQHGVEHLVELPLRDRERFLAPETVVEFDGGLASAFGDGDAFGVVSVLLDGLVGEQALRPVDERPGRGDVEFVLAAEVHLGDRLLVVEVLADDLRLAHTTAFIATSIKPLALPQRLRIAPPAGGWR